MKRISPAIACFLFTIAIMALFCVRGAYGQAQPHTATYTITQTPDCTTTNPCTAQVWRVALPSGSTCPAAGNSAYILVQPALPSSSTTTTGSTWNYVDTGASLVTGAVYCAYQTVTFVAGGAPSPVSAIFQQAFQAPVITPPANAPKTTILLK